MCKFTKTSYVLKNLIKIITRYLFYFIIDFHAGSRYINKHKAGASLYLRFRQGITEISLDAVYIVVKKIKAYFLKIVYLQDSRYFLPYYMVQP